MATNPWEIDWSKPQGSPSGGGLDMTPLPSRPPGQTPMQAQKDALEVRKLQADLAKKEQQSHFREPKDELLNVLEAAGQAFKTSRIGTPDASSPIGRTIMSKIPGTAAKDLSGYLDTIGANTAFKQLQDIRQNSPTGGAVGNVSDNDMKLLRSTIASLDPSQSNEKFTRDLHTVINAYGKVLMKLPGGKEEYQAWRKKFLGFDPDNPKQRASAIAGDKGISPDVQSILDKYGVK